MKYRYFLDISPFLFKMYGAWINAEERVPPSQIVALFPRNGKLFPPANVCPPFYDKGYMVKSECITYPDEGTYVGCQDLEPPPLIHRNIM